MRTRTIDGQVQQQPLRFYDGGLVAQPDGTGGVPPDPQAAPRIVLERHTTTGPEQFSLERRLAYLDRDIGEILVPACTHFRTDLASVPELFLWLVPRTGAHLPAAILHDALVDGHGAGCYDAAVHIDRVQADRIFRDAMADTGTGLIRRWIAWAAVTFATIFVGHDLPWSRWRTWHYRAATVGTAALIAWLGYCATGELFGQSWWLTVDLPWMSGGWWSRLAGGFSGAAVLPLLLVPLWGRLWKAGAIGGVLVAVLFHVTAALAVLYGAYLVLEAVARRSPRLLWLVGAVFLVASLLVVAAELR